MFIVGGFNAYPAEIEQLLGLHPDIADVAVVGVPDPRLGEVGKAYAVRRPGSDAHRRRPDRLVPPGDGQLQGPARGGVRHELPRNASGKVVKGELRAAGVGGARVSPGAATST